jgi:hypothetical protein
VGSTGHIVHSGASTARNVDTLFFMPVWDRYRLHKKYAMTCYAELLLLQPVVSADYIVHSGAFGAQKVDALFSYSVETSAVLIKSAVEHVTPNLCFCIRWDLQVT